LSSELWGILVAYCLTSLKSSLLSNGFAKNSSAPNAIALFCTRMSGDHNKRNLLGFLFEFYEAPVLYHEE